MLLLLLLLAQQASAALLRGLLRGLLLVLQPVLLLLLLEVLQVEPSCPSASGSATRLTGPMASQLGLQVVASLLTSFLFTLIVCQEQANYRAKKKLMKKYV